MLSPTGITNSIPRPLSPRRTAQSSATSQSSQSTNTNNNSPQKTAISPMDASILASSGHRQRGRGEMGLLSTAKAAVACVTPALDKGAEYTEKYVPVAKRKMKNVADTYGPVVKESAVDFAMTAAEAYRQECKSEDQNRGGDQLFFQNPNSRRAPHDEGGDNSLLAGMSNNNNDGSISYYDEKKESQSVEEEQQQQEEEQEQEEEEDLELIGAAAGIEVVGGAGSSRKPHQPFNKQKRKNNANLLNRHNNHHGSSNPGTGGRSKVPLRGRFPNTDDLMPEDRAPPSLRAGRAAAARDDFAPGTGNSKLRATRIELFRQDRSNGLSTAESRLAKALLDLDQQDAAMASLQRQLRTTQSDLDETRAKLETSRNQSQGTRFEATRTHAEAIRERKRMEDRYREEAARTATLQRTIAELRLEISQLRAPSTDAAVHDPWDVVAAAGGPDASSRNQIISLRAEIVELRSQLAEFHASNIDDNASVRTFEELDQLQQKLRDAEAELREAKLKERNFQRLQEQLFFLQSSADETKSKLEERLERASDVEKGLRSELSKTEASLQRMENEKSRKRLLNTAGTNKQLQNAREEISELRETSGRERKLAEERIEELSRELEAVQRKFLTSDGKLKEAEARVANEIQKMEKGTLEQGEMIKALQVQIGTRDDKLIGHLRKISELEALLIDNGVDSSAHLKTLSALEEQVSALRSSEALLRQELDLQKNLLREEREQFQKHAGSSVDKESVRRLKERMEKVKSSTRELQSSTGGTTAVDSVVRETALKKEVQDLRAKVADLQKSQSSDGVKEEILLKEIASLKSRLRGTENLGREERLRSEEERRMSRESSVGHGRELDRLRQEKKEALAAKNRMEEELAELRQKLVRATRSSAQLAAAQSRDPEGAELSGKVSRLRNELAVARARLATAREQSRSFDGDSANLAKDSSAPSEPRGGRPSAPRAPPSPVGSGYSQGSSWAPPSMEQLRGGTARSASSAAAWTPGGLERRDPWAASQAGTAETTSASWDSESPAPKTLPAPALRSAAHVVIMPEKPEGLPPRAALPPKDRSSSKGNLQQRLEESRRRLDKANSKLERLLSPRLEPIAVAGKNDSLLEEVLTNPLRMQ